MCRYHVWHRFQMVISYFVSERRFYQRFASLIITYDRCLFLNIKKLQKIIVLIKTKKEANIRYHHWNNAKIWRKKRKLMNLIHEIQSLMHYWTSDFFNANWIGMDNKINSKNGILNLLSIYFKCGGTATMNYCCWRVFKRALSASFPFRFLLSVENHAISMRKTVATTNSSCFLFFVLKHYWSIEIYLLAIVRCYTPYFSHYIFNDHRANGIFFVYFRHLSFFLRLFFIRRFS